MNETLKQMLEEKAEQSSPVAAGSVSAEEKALEVQGNITPAAPTMWNEVKLMTLSWRTAEMLSQTTLIPDNFKGKTGDCLLAIDIANRLGVSPLMVMQNGQVVRGKFSWNGKACKAFVDGCGKYEYSEYVEVGKEGTDSWGYYLQALRKRDKRFDKGDVVTVKMAKDEGWYEKNPKWRTMTGLMLHYRAASFFANIFCPNVTMGFRTAEEVEDVEYTEVAVDESTGEVKE